MIPKRWSLHHIDRRLDELLESRTFWPSVSAFVALFVSRFLKRRQHDFGDQARIDEMLRVLACIERDFAPAPIDRHEFRMIDRKGTKRPRATSRQSSTSRNPIMRPPSYRQRLFLEHYLGESSGSAVEAARRAWYPWTEHVARKMLRNVASARELVRENRMNSQDRVDAFPVDGALG